MSLSVTLPRASLRLNRRAVMALSEFAEALGLEADWMPAPTATSRVFDITVPGQPETVRLYCSDEDGQIYLYEPPQRVTAGFDEIRARLIMIVASLETPQKEEA